MAAMLWDIFCRVIDNFGDIGVCWRLSADLTQRGHRVRLWIDDASALAWMAPPPQTVEVRAWRDAEHSPPTPGDVVIEAFGCDPPQAFISLMQRETPPRWINLEYLSAEDYVERSHGLPSPVWSGPGAGLCKWFFYPGFTTKTGGLLREPDLLSRRDAFLASPQNRLDWFAKQGIGCDSPNRIFVSVFCYDSAPLPEWLDILAAAALQQAPPVTLLLTPGPATRLARQWQAANPETSAQAGSRLVLHELPHLTQLEFDHLLWSCDLNFVRGEDSAVRAIWAARPHVWQIYEQDDGVHAGKLDAFMRRWIVESEPGISHSLRQAWLRWNGLTQDKMSLEPLIELVALDQRWAKMARQGSQNLANHADLGTQLIAFVGQTG